MFVRVGLVSYVVVASLVSNVKAQVDSSVYSVPEVELEALKSGGFRAYIPHVPGINLFAFHANINEQITQTDPGKVYGEATQSDNGYWIVYFNNTLGGHDLVNYWVFVSYNRLGYRRGDDSWFVKLSDKYKTLSNQCDPAVTTVDGALARVCRRSTIFEDQFNGGALDTNLWTAQHFIPTYSEPEFEFNSYENRNETLYFKNGKLFIKPFALMSENDVRGELDLRQGCTSTSSRQCYYHHASAFLLPPVKSAKLISKHSFQYGNVEIRAKLPAGDWIVPVIELEPKDKNEDDPNCPRLRIAYSRGNAHLSGSNTDDIGSRLLYAGPLLHASEPYRSAKLKQKRSDKPYSDDFHTYRLEWKPGQMSFGIDDNIFDYIITGHGFADPAYDFTSKWNVAEAPFNKEYVLSLGVAVGGINDFPDGLSSPNDPKPWSNGERNYIKKFFDKRETWLRSWDGENAALQIDYVRVTAA